MRCEWCGDDPLYVGYHDKEWGVPAYDDRKLFEFLILEGAQAGLSWITILRKRENYRRLFAGFDAKKIVRFTPEKVEELLQDAGIVRNRLKVNSTVTNARLFLEVQEEYGSFSKYMWDFVDGEVIKNTWKSRSAVPVTTPESDRMSKTMKSRGFKFVGSTICYAYMQAAGMVNDHIVDCFRHQEV